MDARGGRTTYALHATVSYYKTRAFTSRGQSDLEAIHQPYLEHACFSHSEQNWSLQNKTWVFTPSWSWDNGSDVYLSWAKKKKWGLVCTLLTFSEVQRLWMPVIDSLIWINARGQLLYFWYPNSCISILIFWLSVYLWRYRWQVDARDRCTVGLPIWMLLPTLKVHWQREIKKSRMNRPLLSLNFTSRNNRKPVHLRTLIVVPIYIHLDLYRFSWVHALYWEYPCWLVG